MSHEIEKNKDKQQGVEMAWHKLTEVYPDLHERFLTEETHLHDFDIKKSPLFVLDEQKNPVKTDFCQLVCTDDPSIHIGSPVHCETYGMITNAAFLKVVTNALAEIKGAKVVSVGSVCGRAKIFVTVQLAEMAEFKAAGRKVIPFLNFLSSHDQSAPFIVNTSNITTVCANTFSMNLLRQKSGINSAQKNSVVGESVRAVLKHSKNVMERLENIPEIIDGFLGANAIFALEMDRLAAQPIKIDDANALFAGFLNGSEKMEKLSTRRTNQVETLTELFVKGKGNRGENLADVFNAGTDYFTHESSGGEENRLKQYVSSEFGMAANQKTRLYDLLNNENEREDAIGRGHKLLSLV